MRITIEKLAHMIAMATMHDKDVTLGDLSRQFKEPVERIQDALDVLKIRQGKPTQIPPVNWETAGRCGVCKYDFGQVGN